MNIFLTKTTAAQNEVALSHHRVRGLYFLAVVFAATMAYALLLLAMPRSKHTKTIP